ncbi:MAG: hypothetical protein PHY47_11460 [Lachnospiraceae bacterium]|nr:hypothetical protein [Lachnospiraceae bacterium]
MNDNKKVFEDFFSREFRANTTRKKSLDNLDYIQIPIEQFMIPANADSQIQEYYGILSSLSSKKIVNLTGISNTDLKLEYGAPNIIALSEYDQNFTLLASTLARLSQSLLEQGYSSEALSLLEYGVAIGSDVRANYELLGKIYANQGRKSEIETLIMKAETINSLSKETILKKLKLLLEDI